jgi:2-succinyl-6-hydroxy-2,4-cyclohexadiene-1-carboxylate synthase
VTTILLHGFTGSPASFDALDLGPDARALPLLGHGAARTSTTFAAEVDRIAALLPERCHLAGYSMGARVALGILVAHPERVARATLIGVHPGLARDADRRARATADRRWIRLLEQSSIDAFVAAWEEQPLWASQSRCAPDALAAQRAIRLSHDPRGIATALRVLGLAAMPDYTPRLAEIATPVALVVGDEDDKFRAIAAAMTEHLERGDMITIPDCGHNPLIEAPHRIAALLRERTQHDHLDTATWI